MDQLAKEQLSFESRIAYLEKKVREIGEIMNKFSIQKRNSASFKGWYVYKTDCKYEAWIGPNREFSQYAGIKGSRKEAVKIAIHAARQKPYYREEATVEWLKRKGYDDLIPMAKRGLPCQA